MGQQALPLTEDLDSKPIARASLALSPDLKAALQEQADRTGQTLSALLKDFALRRVGMQVASGPRGTPEDPALEEIERLREMYLDYIADQKLKAGELADLTEAATEAMRAFFARYRAGRRRERA